MAKKKVAKKRVAKKRVLKKGVTKKRKGGVGAKKGTRGDDAAARGGGEDSGGVEKNSGGGGLRLEGVAAGELGGHPGNWRRHPASQVTAFRAILEEVGWCGYVLFNRRTGRILDGHMRAKAVPPEVVIPVLSGDWDEGQERLILATYNPIGAQAGVDAAKGRALLEGVGEGVIPGAGVQAVLEGLERAVMKIEREEAKRVKERGPAAEEEEEGGHDAKGRPGKPLKEVRGVMVRCADEGDQLLVLARLRGAGFKVKRAEFL